MSPSAVTAENRGQVGGLYVERQVNTNANVDLSKLSPEELQDKLDKMYEEDIKDVTPRKSEPEASEVKNKTLNPISHFVCSAIILRVFYLPIFLLFP